MPTTEYGRQLMAENAARAKASHDKHEADLLADGLKTLAIGDWVATNWKTDDAHRCGYVVGLVDPTDDEPRRLVDVFEARPRTDLTDTGRQPCIECGALPGGEWRGTSFRCPDSDLIEIRQVSDWNRQHAARLIVRTVADTPGNRWKPQHTRRILMAIALVRGHET
jgi:hypothetical protein